MTEDLKRLIKPRISQSDGWGTIKTAVSINCFLMLHCGYFLNCDFLSRYWNHCSGTPAWLWEGSDKNLVLQQETGPQEHCPNDVKRCGLVYKESVIWKWRRKSPKRGISVWTVVSGSKISTVISLKQLSVALYIISVHKGKEIYFLAQLIAQSSLQINFWSIPDLKGCIAFLT